MEWSKEEARSYLVQYHGFNSFSGGEDGIKDIFNRLHTIQIDPINICGRNHELVLQSRIRGFTPQMLYNQLYKNRFLIEGWEKQASIYRTQDWKYFQRRRAEFKKYIQTNERGMAVYKILPVIRKELHEKGPLSSAEIEYDAVLNWRWAPAKAARAALDALFDLGETVIVARKHNRKIYDLAERVLEKSILEASDPNISEEEYNDFRIQRRIESMGLLWNKAGTGWLDTCKSTERKESLKRLIAKGVILPIKITGIPQKFYIPAASEKYKKPEADNDTVSFLAPLDNMLWDRALINAVFDFDYVWEVYKPASQRLFSYYVLPVLMGNRFIGRIEPVFHSKSDKKMGIHKGTLEIRGWWPEENRNMSTDIIASVKTAIEKFGRFHGAKDVLLSSVFGS